MTYEDVASLPIWKRMWFMSRLERELKRSQESGSTRAAQHNTDEMRSLRGLTRQETPARLRRFT